MVTQQPLLTDSGLLGTGLLFSCTQHLVSNLLTVADEGAGAGAPAPHTKLPPEMSFAGST